MLLLVGESEQVRQFCRYSTARHSTARHYTARYSTARTTMWDTIRPYGAMLLVRFPAYADLAMSNGICHAVLYTPAQARRLA